MRDVMPMNVDDHLDEVLGIVEKPKKEVVTILKWYENEQLLDVIKSLALVLAFIAVVLAVIRPIVKSYLPEPELTEDDDDLATRFKDGELSDEELELIELGDEESLEDIKAKLKPKKSTISADEVLKASHFISTESEITPSKSKIIPLISLLIVLLISGMTSVSEVGSFLS